LSLGRSCAASRLCSSTSFAASPRIGPIAQTRQGAENLLIGVLGVSDIFFIHSRGEMEHWTYVGVSANRYSFNPKLVSMLLQSALDKEASTLILFSKTDYVAIIIYGIEINPFCPLLCFCVASRP
jgi:hypothetical protein